ncbi:MAG TPA: hypothetical protein PLP19_21660 [bacterium]|nr:hypothetical protein [bacterium]HPN46106.1 hypothetical protein [bacterium]
MISTQDKQQIIEIAQKYQAARVFLFGSSIDPHRTPKDIDLAVEGLPDNLFFKFWGELIFALSKPVDLIDLKRETRFTEIIRAEGLLLFG